MLNSLKTNQNQGKRIALIQVRWGCFALIHLLLSGICIWFCRQGMRQCPQGTLPTHCSTAPKTTSCFGGPSPASSAASPLMSLQIVPRWLWLHFVCIGKGSKQGLKIRVHLSCSIFQFMFISTFISLLYCFSLPFLFPGQRAGWSITDHNLLEKIRNKNFCNIRKIRSIHHKKVLVFPIKVGFSGPILISHKLLYKSNATYFF